MLAAGIVFGNAVGQEMCAGNSDAAASGRLSRPGAPFHPVNYPLMRLRYDKVGEVTCVHRQKEGPFDAVDHFFPEGECREEEEDGRHLEGHQQLLEEALVRRPVQPQPRLGATLPERGAGTAHGTDVSTLRS